MPKLNFQRLVSILSKMYCFTPVGGGGGGGLGRNAVASWLVCSSPDRAVWIRAQAADIVLCSWARHFTLIVPLSTLVRVVRKVDNAIHRINHYPVDSVVCFVNTYPLDSELSGGYRYPAFEKLRPGVQMGTGEFNAGGNSAMD